MGDIVSAHCNTSNKLPEEYDESTWMEKFSDDIPLTRLSIPGTFRSASWQLTRAWQHQGLEPSKALKAGIRYFELSLRMKNKSSFELWQDYYAVGGDLDSYLCPFIHFLNKNRSETIICRLTECHSSEIYVGFAQQLWEYLSEIVREEYMWLSTELPSTLGEARGKIIFLRNYNDVGDSFVSYSKAVTKNKEGLSSNFDDNFMESKMFLLEADLGHFDKLHITHTSIIHPIMYPRDCANDINIRILQFLQLLSHAKTLGIIVMDFPGTDLIREIIKCSWRTNEEFLRNNKENKTQMARIARKDKLED